MKIKGPESRYNALESYANLISVVGWIVVVIGIVLVFYGIANKDLLGPLFLVPGISGAVLGLVLVANGQLLSCIRSVEENTRASVMVLSQFAEQFHNAPIAGSDSTGGVEGQTEVEAPSKWTCRCGNNNSVDDDLCGNCGRSPNAII
jgi:hypothetical protein